MEEDVPISNLTVYFQYILVTLLNIANELSRSEFQR